MNKHHYMNLARGVRNILLKEKNVPWPIDGNLVLSIDKIRGGTDGLRGRLTERKRSGRATWIRLQP